MDIGSLLSHKYPLANRNVLQMDQEKPEDQGVYRHIKACDNDPNLDCPVCLSDTELFEVYQLHAAQHWADIESAAT